MAALFFSCSTLDTWSKMFCNSWDREKTKKQLATIFLHKHTTVKEKAFLCYKSKAWLYSRRIEQCNCKLKMNWGKWNKALSDFWKMLR